jgi:hypothetical protein
MCPDAVFDRTDTMFETKPSWLTSRSPDCNLSAIAWVIRSETVGFFV